MIFFFLVVDVIKKKYFSVPQEKGKLEGMIEPSAVTVCWGTQPFLRSPKNEIMRPIQHMEKMRDVSLKPS